MTASRTAVIWAVGLAISVALANVLCLLFVDSTETFAWDSDLEFSVRAAGQTHRHRLEGRADTHIGRHGVNAFDDIKRIEGGKLIFWGDSHVEGFSLDDEDKIAQQFNRLPPSGEERLTAFAFAISGGTIATTYHVLPAFERLTAPVRQHVIVLTRFVFILPDAASGEPYALHLAATPSLESRPVAQPNSRRQEIIGKANRLGLPLPYQLYRRATGVEYRFAPGPSGGGPGTEDSRDIPFLAATWSFLLEQLKARTDVPITFVYCPKVPFLDRGRVVFDDPNEHLAAVFAAACREHGIAFLDLREAFADFFRTTRRFPRGFANNHPYRGHLNREGTRLVAENVADFLSRSSLPAGE